MALYKVFSAPMPTTASLAVIATGTSIITLLQVKPGTTQFLRVVEWGISFDGSAAATPIKVELIETDVAATVTAFAAADIHKIDEAALAAGDPTTSVFAVGTTSSGYNSSGEGSITTVREGDAQLIAPTNQYVFQFPLGYRFVIQPGKFGRIRVKAGTGVNAYAYMLLES